MLKTNLIVWPLLVVAMFIITGCGSSSEECNYSECGELESEIGTLSYAVYQPESVEDDAPLLVLFPGRYTTINSINNDFFAQHFADEYGYILVMAQSPELYWPYDLNGIDAAITLINQVQTDYPVNEQVFLAGISNGAVVSNLVACEYPERITGIFAHAGPLPDDGGEFRLCNSNQNVGIAIIHGSDDDLIHLNGGITWQGVTYPAAPVRESFNNWRQLNGCNEDVRIEELSEFENGRTASIEYAQGCNAPVQFTISNDGPHVPNWLREPLHNMMQQFFLASAEAENR